MQYKVVELSQGSQEWLDWRKSGITATESAVILGKSPYKGAYTLYMEKMGLEVPEDLSNNYFVKRGNALEDEVRLQFETIHNTLAMPVCVESLEHPFLRASLDGFTLEGEVVELKTCCEKVFRSIEELGLKSGTASVYNIQVQHQMLVTGAKKAFLCFLCPDLADNNYIELEIVQDEFLQAQILKACMEFKERLDTSNPPERVGSERVYIPKNDNELIDFELKAQNIKNALSLISELKKQITDIELSIGGDKEEVLAMMAQTDSIKSDLFGLRINVVTTKGSVDYAKALKTLAPNITTEQLEDFRKKGSSSARFSLID